MTGLGTAFAVYRGYIIERGTYFCSRAARKEKERIHDARDDTSFGLVPWDRNDDSLLTHNVIFAVNYTPPPTVRPRGAPHWRTMVAGVIDAVRRELRYLLATATELSLGLLFWSLGF